LCELLKRQQKRCYYCFVPFDENGEGGYYFDRDHMQPLAGGGSNNISNIVLACAACNHDKEQEDWDSFLARRVQRVAEADRSALLAMHRSVVDWKEGLPATAEGVSINLAAPAVVSSSSRVLDEPSRPPFGALKLQPIYVPFRLDGVLPRFHGRLG
jgi:hypothetical protein